MLLLAEQTEYILLVLYNDLSILIACATQQDNVAPAPSSLLLLLLLHGFDLELGCTQTCCCCCCCRCSCWCCIIALIAEAQLAAALRFDQANTTQASLGGVWKRIGKEEENLIKERVIY